MTPDAPDEFDVDVDRGAFLGVLRTYKEYAQSRRSDGDLASAGDFYVAAGRGELMRFRRLPSEKESVPSIDHAGFGIGMRNLLAGALCYRILGDDQRARRHAEQACSIASDCVEAGVFQYEPRDGLCHEIRGDFMLVAGIEGYREAYEGAIPYYEDVDSDLGWQMEDGFFEFTAVVEELASSVGHELPTDEITALVVEDSLTARIAVKRSHLPEILDAVLDAGSWDSDVF